MRHIGIVVLSILLLTLLPAVQAHAASFISIGADPTIQDPDLHVWFKEAGLGNTGTGINYLVTSDATAVYECINNSGKVPGHKVVTASTSISATKPIDKNGAVTVPSTSPITIQPPPSGNFSCPGRMALTLASVSYTNVTVKDLTNNLAATLAGPYVYTNPAAPSV